MRNSTEGQRRFGRQVGGTTGFRTPTTFEERQRAADALQRWKDAQAHTIGDRRAGSEPRMIDDEPQGESDDVE